jgi:hypothetical protein
MALPASFARDGFVTAENARKRMKLSNGRLLKSLMIGTEGESDTGKTEFILSCPGPGIVICIDRGFEPVFDNPAPPPARRSDFAFKIIEAPMDTAATQDAYINYFKMCREETYKACANLDAVTVAIDGDSDFYELQTLAEFGKTTKIWPQTKFGDLYAKRRAMTAKWHDSGKIIIGTSKLRDSYADVLDNTGAPVLEINGEVKRVKSGEQERQGFKDQTYLWNIQIRHLYKPVGINSVTKRAVPHQWGLRIMKCKANSALVGMELWGDLCNFKGLVQLVYPQYPLADWGF